ncbi:hypothetical protein QL285_003891 [Trifolium repens]|nr:hypothetical protein QL285_003891 [Trifolium repens]
MAVIDVMKFVAEHGSKFDHLIRESLFTIVRPCSSNPLSKVVPLWFSRHCSAYRALCLYSIPLNGVIFVRKIMTLRIGIQVIILAFIGMVFVADCHPFSCLFNNFVTLKTERHEWYPLCFDDPSPEMQFCNYNMK